MEFYSRNNWKAERRNRRDLCNHAALQYSTARYERFLPSILATIAITPLAIQVTV